MIRSVPVHGYGNYRFPPQVERKPAVLLLYRGPKAVVRFHDGTTYGIPSEALRRLGTAPGQRFVLVVTRVGGKITEVRVETVAEARPAMTARGTPKVVVRDGRKLITRKR